MKRILLSLMALSLALSSMSATPMVKPLRSGVSEFGESTQSQKLGFEDDLLKSKSEEGEVTVDDLLADPEGTVFSGPFDSETIASLGFQNSDQGRPGMSTKYYQYYSGCTKSINAVRVLGLFNYFDNQEYEWYYCGERPGYDEDYNMTIPVDFEVSFYRIGEDGMPGECVFSKVVSLKGRFTGVIDGNEGNQGPIMEFIAELGEDVKLETGYFSFSAVAVEDVVPTCWFSIFTASSSFGYGLTHMENYGYISATPCVFSLIGTGEYAASKAIRLNGMSAPTSKSTGPMEQVKVSVTNVGTEDINDMALQLEVDGKIMATEHPGNVFPAFTTRNYTFTTRVDLSEVGDHEIKVINVTEGDEKISIDRCVVNTTKLAPGEVVGSCGLYSSESDVIVRVQIGDIDHESEANTLGYEDFTEFSTDIKAGESLDLTATVNNNGEKCIIGVWVDWNNDGMFDGNGELMNYTNGEPIAVKIPEDISVAPGPKRMRVIGSTHTYSLFESSGEYYRGQTEDYTLNVVKSENSAAIEFGADYLIDESEQTTSTIELPVTNTGDADLQATISVAYDLPAIYEERTISIPPADVTAKRIQGKVINKESAAGEEAEYVLRYDKGQYSAVSVTNYSEALFGQCFLSEYMSAIKGMYIQSISTYFENLPETASALIFEKQGEEYVSVYEQEFTPIAGAWNDIILDTPYVITGNEIIYAIKVAGMAADKYYIGMDNGPAVRGYGDLCNVGGTIWWSMADLGLDYNFCIRANVCGNPTSEISWLTVDKEELSVATGQSDKVKISIDRANLLNGTYEGSIIFTTNDPLTPSKSIPVYMTNTLSSGIDATMATSTEATMQGNELVLTSDEVISTARILTADGITIATNSVSDHRVAISLDKCPSGIYFVAVRLADGTKETIKLAIHR